MSLEFVWVLSKEKEIKTDWFFRQEDIHGSLIKNPLKYTKQFFASHDVVFLTSNNNLDDHGEGRTLFDGECVYDGKFRLDFKPNNIEEYFEFINGARGSYCVGFAHSVAGLNLVRFANDQLGMYPLLYFSNEDLVVVTNNPILCETILKESCGFELKRGFEHVVNEITAASPLDVGPFEGMRFVPFDSEIVIHEFGRPIVKRRRGDDYFFRANGSEEELFDCAIKEVLENVKALSEADHDIKIADITGGFDSRLVLAAILNLGVEKNFLFNVNGNFPDPDLNIANLIIEKYGLNKAGVDLNPFKRKASFSGNILQELCVFSYVSSGMKNNVDRNIGTYASRNDLIRIGGGFSAYKANKSKSLKNDCPTIDDAVQTICAGVFALPNEKVARVRDSVRSILRSWIVEQGMTIHDALDRYHIEYRTRFHIGLCEHWSRLCQPKVHPLHSSALVRLAFFVGYEERLSDKLLFQLMERLAPSLCLLPFESRVWKESAYAHSVLRNKIAALKPVTRKSARLYSKEPQKIDIPFCHNSDQTWSGSLEQNESSLNASQGVKNSAWYKSQIALGRKWHWSQLENIKLAFEHNLKIALQAGGDFEWMKVVLDKELKDYRSIKEVLELHVLTQFLIFYNRGEVPLRVSHQVTSKFHTA
ncbi:hypothetical protein [Alcaligenes phenolicus]|uniref:hypothetical protein n=1 Tax=Alcaligenes phenolicus TaxID=232846 RepID=UPI00352DABA8